MTTTFRIPTLSLIALFTALAPPLAAAPPPSDPARLHLPAHHHDASSAESETEAAEAAEKEEKDKDDEKWDVNAPPGPSREVPIRVTEGTWLSLDVSPDGREIAFDLLGDIYLLPIEGGAARAITSGVAWDMQPRFSPDGSRIAFTSDRGGGDNVWVMGRDGSDPKAVTKETFRLLNSPAWAPDGEFIAARKHFTSRRSLGAGEIWLYHRTGGEGLQMTERPNDQKDLGEPAFSPDGRYLYYSRDATPGDRFEYNKDANGEIYVVERLDRESGDIERFLTGPGGSIRPTPSPDGSKLAFARRFRGKTELWIHDVATGDEWSIFDALERDMQETWAVHGVYPSIAWTPDGGSIVFWAAGKIHRIDVASKAVSEISFQVDDTRTVFEALRSKRPAAPDEVDVRMLRWVEVSPKGDRVVYQALGYLYARDLPDGEPRRLTTQSDHFEHYPSFSRDGRWIVYTTWNDEKMGTVSVVAAAGGKGRAITTEPGHYIEPAFSPDGKTVVYRKVEGGWLRSPTWSREAGLWAVPAGGGAPVKVSKEGVRPHFGAGSERVFFLAFEGEGKRALKSVELDGSDERVHFRSENATEFRVSPDERWLAFQERFNAYVTPFPRTGRAIEIGPKAAAMPLEKVSRDAGEYLHWSGDARKLHWALGPELFTCDLEEVFAEKAESETEGEAGEGAGEGAETSAEKAEEKKDEPEEPPVERLAIGFRAPADVPSGALALVGGRVVTMRGDEVIEDGVVVVEGNRLAAVGAASEVAVPAGARVVDVAGATLAPGLIDVHAHGAQGTEGIVPQRNWGHYAGLAFGVTTTHDPSNDTDTIFAAAEMARAGRITAPRIFSTGTILYGAAGSFKAEIDSLEDARSHLRRMQAVGAFSVKSYNQPRRDQRQQVIAAARELDMLVMPEGGSLFQHNMTMVVDGHSGIEHSIPVARIYDDVLQLWGSTPVGYTPTLVVGYGGIWGENYWYGHTDVWENERLISFVPPGLVEARSRRPFMAPEEEYNHLNNARICKELTDAGVEVYVGAHGQREGLAAHWEIWMLVQGGMTPLEALRSATLEGARYLGMEADLGSLEAGKLADLVVFEKDPLADIRNTDSIRYTMVNGRLYDARTMDQVGNHPAKRGPFFWELEPYSTGE